MNLFSFILIIKYINFIELKNSFSYKDIVKKEQYFGNKKNICKIRLYLNLIFFSKGNEIYFDIEGSKLHGIIGERFESFHIKIIILSLNKYIFLFFHVF